MGLLAGTTASACLATDSLGKGPERERESAGTDGNVRQFGAKGDGRADDTQAIQAAVDAGLGSIYFPKGVYRITKTVTIALEKVGYSSLRSDGSAVVVMTGGGPAFRIVGTHNKSADPKGFSENVWDRQRMPMVDNLAIKGEHPEAVGVEASGTMQLSISRLHVRHALHGIHLTGNNRNLIVSDCHLYENKGIGVFYDDVNIHQSNITGCHISYNGGGGVVSKGGNVRNIHITGCDIESNMSRETAPTANVLIDCSSSQYGTAEVAITGCTIQHNNYSEDSANIRILGAGNSAAGSPSRWGNVTITGNILSDVKVNLHLRDCRGVALSGNTFWDGFEHNMLLERCSSVVMGANAFDFNASYKKPVNADNKVRISECEDCTLSGIHLTNVAGEVALLIEDSKRMNISNCTILDSAGTGMMLRNVSHSIITGCLIRNDRSSQFKSLETLGGEGNVITNNLLS